MKKNILIITGGGIKHLEPFEKFGAEFGVSITRASFSKVSYAAEGEKVEIFIDDKPLKSFDLVYYRLIGKARETSAVLVDYIMSHNIKIIDSCHSKSLLFPMTQSKACEMRLLYNADIPIPKTLFGNLSRIKEKGKKFLGFPFVLKRTDGKRSNAVWSPKTEIELDLLIQDLLVEQKQGKRFLAQEFIKGSQRLRVLIIGDKPIACITRGTRWRRRFVQKVDGKIPDKISAVIDPIPENIAQLAVRASKAVGLEIAGVDILVEDETQKLFCLEVNSAPRWYSITRDTGLSVEREIVKYLASLV